MKKSNFIILLFSLSVVAFSSCKMKTIQGDGTLVSQEIAIGDYDVIKFTSNNGEIHYTQSDKAPYLKIECDQNVMERMYIRCNKKELLIRPHNGPYTLQPSKLVITTNSSALRDIKMAGEKTILYVHDSLKCDRLDVVIAGYGCVQIDPLIANTLECQTAGKAKFDLTGRVKTTYIKSAGNIQFKAFDLKTDFLNSKVLGKINVETTTCKRIGIQIMGEGKVRYKENPQISNESMGGCTFEKVQ